MAAFDLQLLQGMPQEQALQYLQQIYAGEPAGPISQQGGMDESFAGYADPSGNQYTYQNGQFARPLTPTFDPTYQGGQYGGYYGTYSPGGSLQDVNFQQAQRDGGWLSNNLDWIGPLAVGGAMFAGAGGFGALGGELSGASDFGSLAGGAAGDMLGAESLLSQAPAYDSLVSGAGMPSSIAGSGLGAGLGANGVLGAMAAAPTIGMGGSLGQGFGGLGGSLAGGVGGAQTLGTLAGAALGGMSAATAPKSETTERRPYVDPRVDAMLMGQDGQPGAIQELLAMGRAGMPAGMRSATESANDWLTNQYGANTQAMQGAIGRQLAANVAAPAMAGAQVTPVGAGAASTYSPATAGQAAQARGVSGIGQQASAQQARAARINAPGQNQLGLSSAFDDYIYGDQAQNRYLRDALQRGANQSRSNFGNLLTDMGQNFSENVLGNIRGGAIAAGGYGGSRQGIAEGIAARNYAQQAGRAAENVGRDLNSAMIGAQSDQFSQGRNLGANMLGNLSGQQYGVAQNQAGLTQGANSLNAQLGTQSSIANAGNATNLAGINANVGVANMNSANNMAQFNAGLMNQAGQFNAGQQNQMGQFNAGLMQNANLANQASSNLASSNNMQAALGTNSLNANMLNSGIGNAGALAGTQYNMANAGYQMPLNRFSQAMQTAQPSFNMYGSGANVTTPLYNNPWASTLAGGIAGAQLGRIWS